MKKTRSELLDEFISLLLKHGCLKRFIFNYCCTDHDYTLSEYFRAVRPADWLASAFVYSDSLEPAYFWININRIWRRYLNNLS